MSGRTGVGERDVERANSTRITLGNRGVLVNIEPGMYCSVQLERCPQVEERAVAFAKM